jgi:hypothetical protein
MGNLVSNNIKELQFILDNGHFDVSTVRSTMVLIRKLLEEKLLKQTFPLLNLYCDWTVHNSLDRTQECLRILQKSTSILVKLPFLNKWKEDGNGGLVWNADEALSFEVNKSLGISELKREIMSLFASQGLPTNIFVDQEKWRHFASVLIRNLADSVIEFPDDIETRRETNQKKIIYNDIQLQTHGNIQQQVIKFSLVYRDQLPSVFQSRPKNSDIFFQMETRSGYYFVGPFWVTEE